MAQKFEAGINGLDQFDPAEVIKAFDYPKTPVITNEKPEEIQLLQWGLIPFWSDNTWNRNYTLNARYETLDDKPSFNQITSNRCLIIVNGFYEWQHLGTTKQRYEIGFNNELFALAGLYDGNTYTVVTTEAQGLMREIHNTKLRMPFALKDKVNWQNWLAEEPVAPNYEFTTIPEVYRQGSLF